MGNKKESYEEMLIKRFHFGDRGCLSEVILVVVVLCFLLCSCATKTKIEYVDREVVKYRTSLLHDTIINNVHDSIYHTIFQKGDTVFDTKYVEKTKYVDKYIFRCDTVYKDSIEVQTQKERKTVIKRVIPNWCYYSLVISGLFLIFALVKVIRWLKIN